MPTGKVLVYLLRRDLRVSDNPVFHALATGSDYGFTHLLPVYIFPCHQMEVSGFVKQGQNCPYPPALSDIGRFWRCGPHRAKFIAEAVWDLKASLEAIGSGLLVRVGSVVHVLEGIFQHFQNTDMAVQAVWMTEEPSYDETCEQNAVSTLCSANRVKFNLWMDQKFLIDDRDLGFDVITELPDVFTSYRKSKEPLRDRPRSALPRPQRYCLPAMPPKALLPPQHEPFVMVDSLDEVISRLLKPLKEMLANPPPKPEGAVTAHPFTGGESHAMDRLEYLVRSGLVNNYHASRNGLLGLNYSTKLGAFLALGCITARQIHAELLKLEDGSDDRYAMVDHFGKGETEGTKAVRFELLWRDYMRLCTIKFGYKLFRAEGFGKQKGYRNFWKTTSYYNAAPYQYPPPEDMARILNRFLEGTTGMGLIDASQRELYHTGYTSNRARQNVASFLSKHLGIDWRYGAEWYEAMLVDYDVSCNWANWQYLAGVGNDPRGDNRIFNPIKQAFEYDPNGDYVRTWVPEIKGLARLENLFQAWTATAEDLAQVGLINNIMVTEPVKRIAFTTEHKPRTHRGGARRWRRMNRRGGRLLGGDIRESYNSTVRDTTTSSSDGNNVDSSPSPPSSSFALPIRFLGHMPMPLYPPSCQVAYVNNSTDSFFGEQAYGASQDASSAGVSCLGNAGNVGLVDATGRSDDHEWMDNRGIWGNDYPYQYGFVQPLTLSHLLAQSSHEYED